MTRVVLAPDSFKGTISAVDAAYALAAGWASVEPNAQFVYRPMADGGEGTVAAFAAAIDGSTLMPITVRGPANSPVDAAWLLLPDGTAVIDLASTSGIELLDQLRPWDSNTTGLGQAIATALDGGATRLIVGIGSSASTDGGTGMLAALGARFLDAAGSDVAPGARGLAAITTVDLSVLRAAPDVRVLIDVTNPLTGPNGAAAVFGPQKGLESHEITAVDRDLARLANLLEFDAMTPGTGAAGGAGGALLAWGATLTPGAAAVAEITGVADALAEADVVLTGEGSYDAQSGNGKVPAFVASLASKLGVSPMLAAGRIADGADITSFTSAVSLTALAGSTARAITEPEHSLRRAGAALARAHLGIVERAASP